ncbi:hypothetical protein X943_001355 [Babesia divergens]|uniref:mRNA 5'-phosphatase n=1 Tax=Babesia divergens TaxID=32595 RepID=A0AAD9GAG8_BABDI|nr:hypothetical protein X943_001355 [Babesia divergens]
MVVEARDTIAGSSAVDCDVIATRLSERLESLSTDGPLAEALQRGDFKSESGAMRCELEIEVRFGIIKYHRDGQRVVLPVTTDALVSERAPVKFVAGVSEAQYKAASATLKQVSEDNKAKSNWKSRLGVLTFDRFFKLPDYEEAVRISVPQSQANSRDKSFEAIRKVKLVSWNVFTGQPSISAHRNDETAIDSGPEHLDYRIAINLEYKVPLRDMPATSAAKICRKKARDSYMNTKGHLRFDLSCVQSVDNDPGGGDGGPCSYEVELELDGSAVIEVLMNESLDHSKRAQLLKYHCATLVRSVKQLRDLIAKGDAGIPGADTLATNLMTTKLGLCDLRFVQHDAESVRRYRKAISPQLPLIGDYLFRAVTPAIEKSAHKRHTRSPYREYIDCIPGPYVVMHSGPLHGKRVVLCTRDHHSSDNSAIENKLS